MDTQRSCIARVASLATALALVAVFASASSTTRAQTSADVGSDYGSGSVNAAGASRVDEKFVYMFEPTARWPGSFHWRYNHSNAPAALASYKASVIAQLQASLNKWTAQCAVTYQYDGETSAAPGTLVSGQPDQVNVVGWGSVDPSVKAWTYDWWSADASGTRTLIDADTTLDPSRIATTTDLDQIMTHEWGHVLGLNHSDDGTAIMAGPPLTSYNSLANLQPDDVRGCRCLYGLPPGAQAGYACSVPHQVDFGNVTTGSISAPQTITFTNSGNAALQIQSVHTRDPQFTRVSGCDPGSSIAPGASCSMQVTVNPNGAGALASWLDVYTSDSYYYVQLAANASAPIPQQQPQVQQPQPSAQQVVTAPTVDVIEFYNAALDHYFITYVPAEIANLDAGNTPTRWTRTGLAFKAYTATQPGTSQVCRYYIPPQDGSSHWFGRSSVECGAAQQAHPEFVLEDANFMQLFLPVNGTCASGTIPVYRVFDNRTDVNHRYTTDRATRDAMVARGWIAEGDGPDQVVMCAPQ